MLLSPIAAFSFLRAAFEDGESLIRCFAVAIKQVRFDCIDAAGEVNLHAGSNCVCSEDLSFHGAIRSVGTGM
ncbi:hypothetical protein AO888_15275 [Pseudomonas aeruginosa]|nr:hypothetical protein AO888_15275 [Pseudomonas aeruginosa]